MKKNNRLFKQMIAVNGIGPKGALAILSVMSANDLRFAIYTGNAKAIAKAPGIGGKTAERVILDLRDKVSLEDSLQGLGGEEDDAAPEDQTMQNAMAKDAVDALSALGYSRTDAVHAVGKVSKENVPTVEELLKRALKYLL
ncbi:MAG: Holliday junction branch migration protein RuvA [Lachnospiraceae bacterium]|nr:Holliday junction branch migration protein RuvA [Lachnospiraceae bacterium]